jgi:hypothetical protein
MASINASTSGAGGVITTADSSGVLNLQSGGANVATINAFGIGLGTGVPASGIGITFPATQSASADANTLDDYEEGTWTPTFTGASTSGSCTYVTGQTTGTYVKIGQFVFTSFSLSANSTHSGTGGLRVSNFPFTFSSTSNWGGSPSIGYFAGSATNMIYISGYTDVGATYLNLQYQSTTAGTIQTLSTAAVQNGFVIIGTLTYRASA